MSVKKGQRFLYLDVQAQEATKSISTDMCMEKLVIWTLHYIYENLVDAVAVRTDIL